MKICLPILALACAGLLWGGCATPGIRPAAAAAGGTSAATGEDDSLPVDGLVFGARRDPLDLVSAGKGNPESLAHFATAESYQTNGQRELALEEFRKSVLADPSNEELALELTRVFMQEQHPEKAVTLLTKVASRPDASATVFSWLARADLQAGKTNEALAASRKAIERRPDSLGGYESQLEILVQTGRADGGLRLLDQAARHIRAQPGNLVALADLYSVFLAAQSGPKAPPRLRAVGLLDQAAGMKFNSPPLWERMADTYARLGEPKKAMDIYTKLLAQPQDDAGDLDVLRYKSALISMDTQDWTNATRQFRDVVRNNPGHFPEAWYYLGIMAHADNRLAEASDDFENALRWNPGLEVAYYHLALVWVDLDHGPEALRLLGEARARFGDSFAYEFHAGLVNMRIKDFDEAVARFTAAEGIARTNNPAALDPAFYFQIGAACERDRQFPRAAQYLQKCVDMEPDNAEALNYLGFMWADQGEQLPKARAYIEKAVKQEPTNAAYLDSLGWVLYKLKLPQEALPWMLKAVELSTEPDATILDHLGDVYMALRQPAKALESWKKSLAIEPNDEVRKKLRLFDAGAT
jgi:tetratricopeptide (TPR) repeat protein